jgi:hypothetical protein
MREGGRKRNFTHVFMAMLQPFGLDEKPESTQRSSSEQQTRQCLLRRCFAASLKVSQSFIDHRKYPPDLSIEPVRRGA